MTTLTVPALKKCLDSPDELKEFRNGKVEIVHLDDVAIGRIRLQPGWKWSEDVKPLAKTETCQVRHLQYIISGRLLVKMDDGTEMELKPGDAVVIPPGHEALVLGEEPVEAIDFGNIKDLFRESDPGNPEFESGILYETD